MENSYKDESSVLEQAPAVEKLQIDLMHNLDFRAVARRGSWVLWEISGWPEVCVWIQNFQTDLSTKYIFMQVFKSGMNSGKEFQANEFRLSLGLPPVKSEDFQRLSAFDSPWLAIELNPRHGRHES